MSDDEHEEPAKRSKLLAWVIVLVVYVLSFGPATWLFSHGVLSPKGWTPYVFRAIYYPLFWLAGRADWLRTLISWYQNLL